MAYDGIIFDLDGTLWDSTDGVLTAWCAVLAEAPDVTELPDRAALEGVMGLTAEALTAKLFPYLTEERRMALFDACAARECAYLSVHGGKLYPHIIETLEALGAQHPLFIVSNCPDGYIQSFLTAHNAARLFRDFECIGRTGLQKSENIRLIAERNGLKSPVYVGDTEWDCTAAESAGVPFLFAAYGFGHVENHPTAHTPAELLQLIDTERSAP